MTTLDPATGQALPDTAIQRILFITPKVHIYQIPPITSNAGFSASSWTNASQPTAQQIFSARLRIIETSGHIASQPEKIKCDLLLEDPSSGALFAAAPYTSPAVVQQANDSSRFFAIRVVGERGMKATLGMGFEDRSPAFDFSIALTEARKSLGFDANGGVGAAQREAQLKKKMEADQKKDFSLKEGETIHINVGGKGRREKASTDKSASSEAALFSIAPPPPAGGKVDSGSLPSIAPPPSSANAGGIQGKTAQELGFDDGEFGEFQ